MISWKGQGEEEEGEQSDAAVVSLELLCKADKSQDEHCWAGNGTPTERGVSSSAERMVGRDPQSRRLMW